MGRSGAEDNRGVLLGSRNSRRKLTYRMSAGLAALANRHAELSAVKLAGDPPILLARLKIEKTVKHFSAHRRW